MRHFYFSLGFSFSYSITKYYQNEILKLTIVRPLNTIVYSIRRNTILSFFFFNKTRFILILCTLQLYVFLEVDKLSKRIYSNISTQIFFGNYFVEIYPTIKIILISYDKYATIIKLVLMLWLM